MWKKVCSGEVAVKNNSKVTDLRGGRQSGVVDVEAEVMRVRDLGPMMIMIHCS